MTAGHLTPEALLAYLDELGVSHATVDHPPVFTVEEARRLRGDLPGGHCKSLFLRNKKGRMWLVVLREDRRADLAQLAASLDSGRLSFGSSERLMRHLGVIPGAVTPLAVVNDRVGAVGVAIEAGLLEEPLLNFHPLDNARTTAISPHGLLTFLEATGHPPKLLNDGEF